MMDISLFLVFAFGSIGMTHIIVDGAIFDKPREWLRNKFPQDHFITKLTGCYQCTGFWVGVVMGAALVSYNPLVFFACGCASSFLSDWAAIYLNSLEANTALSNLDENEE